MYPEGGSPAVMTLEEKLRVDVGQAVRARRASASVYVSFSERVGIPLSLMRPDAPHILIAHVLTSSQKRRVAQLTGYLRRTDVTLVFSRALERYLHEEMGLPAQQARFVSDKVDQRFFVPEGDVAGGGYVLSVGREQRDYETLIEALRPLRTPAVIVPGSTWSHRSLTPLSVPDHVELREGLSYSALRALYQAARLVVVPINPDTDYAAGVNGILEAMACARPVVASDTPGLSGYVRDGEDGRQVQPGDPLALRSVIEELWDDRGQAERLALAGRQTVEQERTIENFVARISDLIDELV
jgi:glycosyltransferase involved in cell wall biosynthesis